MSYSLYALKVSNAIPHTTYNSLFPTPSSTYRQYQLYEHLLLASYLLGKLWLFISRIGIGMGYDVRFHLQQLDVRTWLQPLPPIYDTFYGYHPPLGFLFARTLNLIGFTQIHSVQILSMAAMLLAFFCCRTILKRLDLLHTLRGIVFLYTAFSLPIMIYVSMSINLDVLLLAYISVLLFCSIQYYWNDVRNPRLTYAMIALSVIGLLTKYSFVVALSIPILVAILSKRKKIYDHCRHAGLMILMCVIITSPYYFIWNPWWTGEVFPSNVGTQYENIAIERRDRDVFGFLWHLMGSSAFHDFNDVHYRDTGQPTLFDAWKDLWIADAALVDVRQDISTFGLVYMGIGSLLMMVGLLFYALSVKDRSLWHKLGWVILSYNCLLCIAFVLYIYQHPHGIWMPTKGLYVLPIVWAIGFLVAHACDGILQHMRNATLYSSAEKLVLGALLCFMLANHMLPIY